jgi:hypothetical protein
MFDNPHYCNKQEICEPGAHVVGNLNTIRGSKINSRGNDNNIYGPEAVVDGDGNTVMGPKARITGNHNHYSGKGGVIDGDYNIVRGDKNKVNGRGVDVAGKENTVNGVLFPLLEEKKGPKQAEIKVPASDAEDMPAKDPAVTCTICLINEPVCAAMPCGHKKFCIGCSIAWVYGPNHREKRQRTMDHTTCPTCRAEVESYQRIFE